MASLEVAVLDVVVDEAEVVPELDRRCARQRLAMIARDRGVRQQAEEGADPLAAVRAGTIEREVIADHLVQAVGRGIAVLDQPDDLAFGVGDQLGEVQLGERRGHRGASVHETCSLAVACWRGGPSRRAARTRARAKTTPARGTRPHRRLPEVRQKPRADDIRRQRPVCEPRATVAGEMPAPRRYTTEAIVLSRFDLGEADRVLTLITPAGGKLKAIAKGVRRTTSRLGGSLEPFAELTVSLARGRTFEVVTQVSVGHAWLNLRDSLESAATAWYLAELADRSLEERHAAEPLYALLRRAYELLDAGMAPGRVARWYEMHLLDELGMRPEVDRCVECDRMLEAEERFRWVPPLGGVICQRCPGPPHERTGLTLEGLKLLKAYQRLDIEALAELRLAAAVEREVETALRDFVGQALERAGALARLPRRGPAAGPPPSAR